MTNAAGVQLGTRKRSSRLSCLAESAGLVALAALLLMGFLCDRAWAGGGLADTRTPRVSTDTASTDSGWATLVSGADPLFTGGVTATKDGGFILLGVSGIHPSWIWGVKTDSSGTLEWRRKYASNVDLSGGIIKQTSDGGYIVGGSAEDRAFVMKVDESGQPVWAKSYGQGKYNALTSIQQTAEGGYIVGMAMAPGSDEGPWFVGIIKLDAKGAVSWQRVHTFAAYGCVSVSQASDGGYMLACQDEFRPAYAKLDSSGNIVWQKVYGTINDVRDVYSAQQTRDGGYVLAGKVYSSPDENHSGNPYCMKVDRTGAVDWERVYVGGRSGSMNAVRQAQDGGYLMAGSQIRDPKLEVGDAWVIKVGRTGAIEWQKRLGWTGSDQITADLLALPDGASIIAVSTGGFGDASGFAFTSSLLLRLSPTGKTCPLIGKRAVATSRLTHPKVAADHAGTQDRPVGTMVVDVETTVFPVAIWNCDSSW